LAGFCLAADRSQNSRRSFLRALAALAPTIGLAAPTVAAAHEEGPTEDPALLPLGRRAAALEEEYELAYKAEYDADRVFQDALGPWPAVIRLDDDNRDARAIFPHGDCCLTFSMLRRELPKHSARTRRGKWLRRAMTIAEAREKHIKELRVATGADAAAERKAAINAEIETLVDEAFDQEPRTFGGLLAIAQAFMAAHGPNEPGWRRLYITAERPLALAEAVIKLLDPQKGELQHPAAIAARAERRARDAEYERLRAAEAGDRVLAQGEEERA
jgi:hypothetical protein